MKVKLELPPPFAPMKRAWSRPGPPWETRADRREWRSEMGVTDGSRVLEGVLEPLPNAAFLF